MNPVTWFRTSAALFILFAAGHTLGFLRFRPSSPDGLAVWEAMNSVRFSAGHATFSYGDFYIGFGLFITLFYVFSAWMAWFLGSMAKRGVADARAISWALFAVQIVGFGLSLEYFSLGPAVLSAITSICLGVAAISMRQVG